MAEKPGRIKAKPSTSSSSASSTSSPRAKRGKPSPPPTSSMTEQQQPQIKREPKEEVTDEDRARFESYVGQEWTGTVKWFNVSKGFGFISPHHEEAQSHDYELFAHQSEIQKQGFRSLADNSEVKFTVAIGKRGLEAKHITNLEGGEPEGHHIRPMSSHREEKIRCYNCGALGKHTAKQCKKPKVEGKACYRCGSADHLFADCPENRERRERRERTPQAPTE